MNEFLETATSFPTVVFSVLLIVALTYWGISVLGGLGVDGVEDISDGGLDGADSDGGMLDSLAGILRLEGVPLSISLSVWATAAWFLSFELSVGMEALDLSGSAILLTSLAAFLLALFSGLVVASLVARPLARAMRTSSADPRSALVGATGVVTTGRITSSFGQAEVNLPGGGTALVQVRCETGPSLSAGQSVLLVEYDLDREAFLVVPDPSVSL